MYNVSFKSVSISQNFPYETVEARIRPHSISISYGGGASNVNKCFQKLNKDGSISFMEFLREKPRRVTKYTPDRITERLRIKGKWGAKSVFTDNNLVYCQKAGTGTKIWYETYLENFKKILGKVANSNKIKYVGCKECDMALPIESLISKILAGIKK